MHIYFEDNGYDVEDYINNSNEYDSKFRKLLVEIEEFKSFTGNQTCNCSEYFFSIIADIAENHIIISDLEEFQIRSFTVGNFNHYYVIPKSIEFLYTVSVKSSNEGRLTTNTFGLIGEMETFIIEKLVAKNGKILN